MAFLVSNVKVDTDVDRYHDVVFGWDFVDRALESDRVLCDHSSDSPCITQCAEAAMKPWIHNTFINSETLPDGVNTVRNVQARDAAF